MNPSASSSPDPDAVFIGIDLGGTSIHAAAVQDGRVLVEAGEKTPGDSSPENVVARIASLVNELRNSVRADTPFAGLCIGAPGAVDTACGVVGHAPNLDWNSVPLGPLLSDATGLPVIVENDVTIGAVGEHVHGAGRGTRSMVAIFVGTGIGGGIIIDGKPVRGARGGAGEIGHMVAVPDGRLCPCGRRGCFEAYASKTAVEAILRERIAAGEASVVPEIMAARGKRKITSSVIQTALDRGDPVLTEVVEDAQRVLAILVADLVNAIDPEAVVFGGGLVARLGEAFVDPIAEQARPRFLQQAGAEDVRIVPGELGDQAGTLGAAALAAGR